MKTKKIGDLLREKGFITDLQLEQVLAQQKVTGQRLGELLVERKYITEEQLVDTISERLAIPRISLESMVIDPAVIQMVPVHIARRYTLMPVFAVGTTLTIAMSDPLNIIAIDEIKYLTNLSIQRSVATNTEIKLAIDKYYSVADSLNQIIGDQKKRESSREIPSSTAKVKEESETPVIKLVNLIVAKAVKEKASDVHIEPEEDRIRIRYRISGIMREEAAPPKSMQNELVSRIKIASNLDVSEKRLPQDGRFLVNVDGANIDLRVSTLPTIHGEKVVIRILDRRNLLLSFKHLGFNNFIEQRWCNIIRQPEGLILLSGPTSSGKTSTLYATLQEINSVEKNVITIEDPVEYSLPLIIQIQINEKAGLTFPSVLRSILRQNPDVIMVGEIRDAETARLAIRSSLTGHLVFSTIHTNDAPSTISRLMDMGIENYLLASAFKGVLAQRLVRLNCPECVQEYTPSELVLQKAGLTDFSKEINYKHGAGCPRCRNTGFKGQTGIFEYLEVTPKISELIARGATAGTIRNEARQIGYHSLFEIGLEKISTGEICLEELLKETSLNEDPWDHQSDIKVTRLDANPV